MGNQDDEEVKESEENQDDEEVEDAEEVEEDDDEEQPANASSPQEEEEEDDGEEKVEVVLIPDNKIGMVCGRGRQHLRMIEQNTGVKHIKQEDQGTFVIRGRAKATIRAK